MNIILDPALVQLAIAAFTAITAIMTYFTNRAVKKTQLDVANVKIATNGINAALVKVTGEAQFAAGKDEGRAEGEIRAAALAEGQATKS